MTFQVALAGNDGFVIASDRKVTSYMPCLWGAYTDKILVSKTEDIVCAFSGTDLGKCVALNFCDSDLAGKCKDKSNSTGLELSREAERIIEGYRAIDVRTKDILSTVIIGFPKVKGSSLWSLPVKEGATVVPKLVSDVEIAGDVFNPSGLFANTFFACKPVDELIFLAAHSVIEAGRFNPTTVGGLDVVVCRENKVIKLTQEQKDELTVRSEKLRQRLSEELLVRISV